MIYTKTGDKGETSLYDGTRVKKHSIRVESYGTIDELNAHIGNCRQFIEDDKVNEHLMMIQRELFNVGGELATTDGTQYKSPVLEEHVLKLEELIDYYLDQVNHEKAFKFTLPGSSKATASLHVARTVCRRAERVILGLSEEAEISLILIKYVNRLSDFLYTLTLYLEDNPIYL